MNLNIKKPEALYEIGERDHNEDFIYPIMNEASPEERLFIVADGEGGVGAGDIGSKLLALTIAKYFQHPGPKGDVDQAFLDQALKISESALTAHKDVHTEARGMAISMAMVHFGEKHVSMAWKGSCRVYHYSQKGERLFNPATTKKVAPGEQENLISGSESPQKLNTYFLPVEEVGEEDYFLLITDGISNQLTDSNLLTILQAKNIGQDGNSPEKIANEINKLIQNFAKDNYSAYILQVEKEEEPEAAVVPDKKVAVSKEKEPVKEEAGAGFFSNPQFLKNLGIATIVILVLAMVVWGAVSFFGDGFDRNMARGKRAMDQRSYTEAKNYFEKAIESTEDPTEKQEARNLLEQLERIGAKIPDERMTSVNDFLEKKQYGDAISYLEEIVGDLDLKEDPYQANIVRAILAEVYVRQADSLYAAAGEGKKCEAAYDIYNKGLKILERPDVSSNESALFAQARERVLSCGQEKGDVAIPLDGLAENKRVNERALAPANDKPSTNGSQEIASNARTTRSESSELSKFLDTGKRSFVQARNSNSPNQYEQARENLENSGAALDGAGAYMLAFMYHSGLGGEKSDAKALKYAQKSAGKGWPSGQYYYGHLLLLRQYPRDTVTAIQSLRKAADKNFLDAIKRLDELGVKY
jgi:serine/threonine protein phosphatase PrpC